MITNNKNNYLLSLKLLAVYGLITLRTSLINSPTDGVTLFVLATILRGILSFSFEPEDNASTCVRVFF